jgi:hypothetical protein
MQRREEREPRNKCNRLRNATDGRPLHNDVKAPD